MNSKQSIEEAAMAHAKEHYKDDFCTDAYKCVVVGARSDAAKEYWFEQFKAQEQVLSEDEAYALWRVVTPQPSDTLYDKNTFEWHRRSGRLHTAKDFHNIAAAFAPKAQEQKPITDEEIEALAEKEYPLAVAVDNSELSSANKEYNAMQDIKAIHFIKGFKAALKLISSP